MIGKLDRFLAVEIDIDQPAGRLTENQTDVVLRREVLFELIRLDPEVWPVVTHRHLRPGAQRHAEPATAVVDGHLVTDADWSQVFDGVYWCGNR